MKLKADTTKSICHPTSGRWYGSSSKMAGKLAIQSVAMEGKARAILMCSLRRLAWESWPICVWRTTSPYILIAWNVSKIWMNPFIFNGQWAIYDALLPKNTRCRLKSLFTKILLLRLFQERWAVYNDVKRGSRTRAYYGSVFTKRRKEKWKSCGSGFRESLGDLNGKN